MSRLSLVLLILLLALAACAPSGSAPSPGPSEPPVTSSPPPNPSERPSPSTPAPVVTPTPSASPSPTQLTADERYLIDGIRRTAIDCRPVRDGLPDRALAGVECRSDDPAVARMGFYRFASDADMLEAYLARMRAEGVELDSVGCIDGEGESGYIPDEGMATDRHGCFINADGYANYRATISGSHVYVGLLGRSADMRALEDFAWRGNQDVPGNPTLWSEPTD